MSAALLGRWLRRRTGDARQAEALQIVVVTVSVLAWLLAQVAAWAVLHGAIEAAPGGPVALAFWGAQLGALLLIVGVGLLGVAPAITVTVDAAGLHLRRGRAMRHLPHAAIEGAERVTALHYHRHYAPYAATQPFINRLPATVLLLHTTDGPYALGLDPADQDLLLAHLEADAPAEAAPVLRVA